MAYITITRPINCIFGSFTILIGMLNVYIGPLSVFLPSHICKLILGITVYIFIAAASNVINDVFDLEIDLINRPDRPIPSGKISKFHAIIYSSILGGLGILMSFVLAFFSPNPILVPVLAIVFMGLGLVYSWKGKKSGFPGNVLVGVAFAFGIPFGAMILSFIDQFPPKIWFFFGTAVLLLISRELVKGMEDIEGDSTYHHHTVANTKGFRFTAWISGCFSLSAILTFTIPAFLYSFNMVFMIVMAIANVFVLASIILLIKPDRKKNPTRASLCLKIGAYLGLIAYILAVF